MILVDYTAICYRSVFAADKNNMIDEGYVRHLILNSLRMYNKKFRRQYGEMILCCDGRSWRKDFFKPYKGKRKESRDEDPDYWEKVFGILEMIRAELHEFMPYMVIHEPDAEADDVIAALATRHQHFGDFEDILIISHDKDMMQLTDEKLTGNKVRQWCPTKKTFMSLDDVPFYRFEHFVRGDGGDGIPNIFSKGDTFMTPGVRQRTVFKKDLLQWWEQYKNGAKPEDIWEDEEVVRRFKENKTMIDLIDGVPEDIKKRVIAVYENSERTGGKKVLNYLIKKRCRMLIECAGDFMPV